MTQAEPAPARRRGLTLTQQIFLGLFLGILAGAFVEAYHPGWAIYFRPFSQIFLRLIKMVIAPLIFATLVAGIAGAGHFKVVGRMGLRAIIYFEVVTTLALVIGLVAVNVEQARASASTCRWASSPGSPPTAADLGSDPPPRRPRVGHRGDGATATCSRSSSSASSSAIALGMIGEKGRPVIAWCEALAETMFKFTNIVMHYAPIGVGAAIAYTVGHGGARRALQPRLAGGDALSGAGRLHPRGLPADRADLQGADPQVRQGGQGAGDDRLLDDVERSGAAARDGSDRAARRAAPNRRLRPAARLQLQSRRHHAVPVAGVDLRRPGGRHAALDRPADHDAADADADQQRGGRGAARLAGDPGRRRSPATACRSKG